MSWVGESNAIEELRDHWVHWTSLVELFVRRRRARHKVSAEAYEQAHAQVVQSCRWMVSMVDDDEKTYFRGLEELAAPWVSPSSFRMHDREILGNLLHRCRRVERELGARRLVLPDLHKPTRLVLSLMAFLAFMFVFWTAGAAWSPILQRGRTWSDAVAICVHRTRYVHHILIPGILVVTASSYVVARSARV